MYMYTLFQIYFQPLSHYLSNIFDKYLHLHCSTVEDSLTDCSVTDLESNFTASSVDLSLAFSKHGSVSGKSDMVAVCGTDP